MKKIILINLFLLLSFQIVFGQKKPIKAKKSKPTIVNCGVCNQKAIYLPKPEYPKAAKFVKVSGSVNISILIDENGNVESAKAVSGNPLLRLAAEKAASQAKFEPFKLSGKAVKVRGTLVYNFINDSESEKIVKSGILNGKAINMTRPDYPQKAKDLCIGGKVEVEVLVSEKGDVIEANAISGDELLRDVSMEAAKKVKFNQTPHFYVKVKGILIYNFDSFVKCINTGIVNKKAVSLPKPKVANLNQPKHLQINKEEIIAVQIVIEIDGKVIAARAISGHPMLRPACETSAHETQFSPTPIAVKIKALLVYKFKADGTIDTDIERDDKSIIGTPINLVKPPPPFCNCRFGGKTTSVLVEAKTDEEGNVIAAKAINGHPILKNISEKAALESKFLPTFIKAKILIQYNFEATDESVRDVRIKDVEIKEVKF